MLLNVPLWAVLVLVCCFCRVLRSCFLAVLLCECGVAGWGGTHPAASRKSPCTSTPSLPTPLPPPRAISSAVLRVTSSLTSTADSGHIICIACCVTAVATRPAGEKSPPIHTDGGRTAWRCHSQRESDLRESAGCQSLEP